MQHLSHARLTSRNFGPHFQMLGEGVSYTDASHNECEPHLGIDGLEFSWVRFGLVVTPE
jgi:hypothetical protein